MRHKILYTVLILVTLFSCCEIPKNNVDAMSSTYLTDNYEKDIITNDDAILNVELINSERKKIDAFEIAITCDNVEIVKYQKKVNDDSNKIYATFDIKKDTGKKLDSGKEYEYIITTVSSDSLNESMYTLKNRFVTNNVKVVSTLKTVKKHTAFVRLKIENPKKEKLLKMGIKIFSNGKLLKDCSKDIEETKETLEYVFDVKADAGVDLEQNKKYNYITYVVLDVSKFHLYSALSFDEGMFKTFGKTTVKTKIYKSKKIITFKNTISNPYEKISRIKIVIIGGKKKYEVYNKKFLKRTVED